MTHKKRTQTPEYQWEQALIDAYYDYRWRQVLEPLYQKVPTVESRASWITRDMDEAIHQTHKQTQEVYSVFTLKREILVRAIQLNEEWFQAWVKDNPPPAGYKLG